MEVDGIAVDPERPTGLMLKERRTAAVTRVRYYRRHGAGSSLGPEHVLESDVQRAAWVHLSGITPALSASARDAVRHAADLVSASSTRLCFDLNFRSALWSANEAVPMLVELTKGADLVLATLEEAALVTGSTVTDSTQAASALAELGPRIVVVKRGAQGAVAWEDGAVHETPAVAATLIDPVGAGDSFAAGLLAELARGVALEQALRTAAAVAAVDVSCPGDWEGLPTRPELAQLRGADVLR